MVSLSSGRSQVVSARTRTPSAPLPSGKGATFVRVPANSKDAPTMMAAPTRARTPMPIQPSIGGFVQSAAISAIVTT